EGKAYRTPPPEWAVYPQRMHLTPAMSAFELGLAVLLFTGVAAPLAGLLLRGVAGGWESLGGGPFALLREEPARRRPGGAAEPVDPAIQAAEVRQMLAAKSARRERRGEAPLDVEAEAERLLAEAEAEAAEAGGADP